MPSKHKRWDKWTSEEHLDWLLALNAQRQIDLALFSFREMEEANERLKFGRTKDDNEMHEVERQMWVEAQSFLAIVGQVSDLFDTRRRRPWGTDPEAAKVRESRRRNRAVRLSRLCQVPRTSPLHQRTVRNAFIHIFERIEDLARENPGKTVLDWSRVNPDPRSYEEDRLVLRCIDPGSLRIYHQTSFVDSRQIAAELQRIRAVIHDHLPAEKKMDRLRRRLEREGRELAESYGDIQKIHMPDEWHGPWGYEPPREKPREILDQYVSRHNLVVRGKDPDYLGDLFDRDAQFDIYGLRFPILDGRKAIIAAFRRHPPKQRLRIDWVLEETGEDVVAIYGWEGNPRRSEGVIVLRTRRGEIYWLRVFKISGATQTLSSRHYVKHRKRVFNVPQEAPPRPPARRTGTGPGSRQPRERNDGWPR